MRELGTLDPGQSMEGVLLAITIPRRISSDYLHGEKAFATLFAMDQFGREHSSEIEVSVNRRATMRLSTLSRPRGGLFDTAEQSSIAIARGNLVVGDSARRTGDKVADEVTAENPSVLF